MLIYSINYFTKNKSFILHFHQIENSLYSLCKIGTLSPGELKSFQIHVLRYNITCTCTCTLYDLILRLNASKDINYGAEFEIYLVTRILILKCFAVTFTKDCEFQSRVLPLYLMMCFMVSRSTTLPSSRRKILALGASW